MKKGGKKGGMKGGMMMKGGMPNRKNDMEPAGMKGGNMKKGRKGY